MDFRIEKEPLVSKVSPSTDEESKKKFDQEESKESKKKKALPMPKPFPNIEKHEHSFSPVYRIHLSLQDLLRKKGFSQKSLFRKFVKK